MRISTQKLTWLIPVFPIVVMLTGASFAQETSAPMEPAPSVQRPPRLAMAKYHVVAILRLARPTVLRTDKVEKQSETDHSWKRWPSLTDF